MADLFQIRLRLYLFVRARWRQGGKTGKLPWFQ